MRNYIFHIIFPLWSFISVSAQVNPNLYKNSISDPKMEIWVDSVFDSLSDSERVGQLFVLCVDNKDTPQNRELARKYVEEMKVGGLLFTGGSAIDQANLTNYCQSLAKTPLMITLDGEWGLAMRLTDTQRFPVNMALGALSNDSLIYEYGREVGRQCKRMGIHVNFAPVLDVNSNPDNPVIGYRSFGENPKTVAHKSIMYAKGLEDEGIIAVAKHFPGHGDTSDDSHFTLPVIKHSHKRVEEYELFPFQQYINAGLSGIMVGHLSVPALDNVTQLPSSLSPLIIDSLLRQKMKFEGLVFTDALSMKGVANQPEIGIKVLQAGNDIILKPALPLSEIETIQNALRNGTLSHELIEEKCLKVLRYKYICGLNKNKPVDRKNLIADLNSVHAQLLNNTMTSSAITLLKNEGEYIPLKHLDKNKIAIISIGEDRYTEFQRTADLYTETKSFCIDLKTNEKTKNQYLRSLNDYNTIIVALHSANKKYTDIVNDICKERNNTVLVYFTTPYQINQMPKTAEEAKTIIVAYENSKTAQNYAAQLLFGGISAKGKLPVSINKNYTAGVGKTTPVVRLGYELPEEVGMSSPTLSQIAKIVNEGIRKMAFPGCQILIAKNGKIIYNQPFGYFDYAKTHPVTTNDLYDLASVTKTTATLPAIMKLKDKKKIQLNQFAGEYIPELTHTDKKQITINQLLFHESGMPPVISITDLIIDSASYTPPLYKNKRDGTYRLQVDESYYANNNIRLRDDLISTQKSEDYPYTVANNLYGHKSLPDSIFNQIIHSKLNKPNQYVYSCLNFSLLKKIAENITRQPLDEYVSSTFYKPLGAWNITYKPLEKGIPLNSIAPTENDGFMRNQILIGYTHDEMAAFSGNVEGNAGLFSNANDLAKLFQLYLNNGTYGGELYYHTETGKLFTTTKSKISRRGLGFDKPNIRNLDASPTCEEAPASVYGHTGYTGTSFWIDPDNELIFIFLSNRVYPHRWYTNLTDLNIRPRIQSVIYNSLTKK